MAASSPGAPSAASITADSPVPRPETAPGEEPPAALAATGSAEEVLRLLQRVSKDGGLEPQGLLCVLRFPGRPVPCRRLLSLLPLARLLLLLLRSLPPVLLLVLAGLADASLKPSGLSWKALGVSAALLPCPVRLDCCPSPTSAALPGARARAAVAARTIRARCTHRGWRC